MQALFVPGQGFDLTAISGHQATRFGHGIQWINCLAITSQIHASLVLLDALRVLFLYLRSAGLLVVDFDGV